MSALRKTTTHSEDIAIKKRLIACMPASKFEMQTLTRLIGIQTTRALPTAAVECKRHPRLLINPDFVEKFCKRDEHLFLLVMHELWHVMLAHTRMYPRMTQAQNIAFDAIINAGLMQEFWRPEYRGFFEAVNAADQFPHCLLRPPVGWPENPVYPEVGPAGTRELLMRLYPPGNFNNFNPPLYEEVLALLLKGGFPLEGVVLLGNHNGPPEHDPLIKEMMKEATAKWPKLQIGAPGEGDYMRTQTFGVVDPNSEHARRVFSRTLRLCLGNQLGVHRRKAKMPIQTTLGTGVLPNARDRLAPARRSLGAQGVLWAQPGEIRARVRERPSKAYVYLDVSGSMNYVLMVLLGLILPYVAHGEVDVFQFSTAVTALSLMDLRRGHLTTTGGTDINAVLEHVLQAKPKINRILLLTDGETGSPTPHLAQAIREHRLRLHVVLPDECNLDIGVQEIATSIVTLPAIY